MSDGLVARGYLKVSISIEVDTPVQTVHIAVNGCVQVLAVLVHQPQIEVDGSKVRMVVATDHLEDLQRLVHVLKSFGEILASVVVKAQV